MTVASRPEQRHLYRLAVDLRCLLLSSIADAAGQPDHALYVVDARVGRMNDHYRFGSPISIFD
jgi:hypothetical protein